MLTPRIGSLAVSGMAVAGLAVAQISLPAPEGKYSVGRTQISWVDDAKREIVVWIWYPAKVTAGSAPAQWMPGKWSEGLHVFRSDSVSSHAYTDAPIEPERRPYPVLLFAPGSATTPLDYSTILEDVASHGYVVAGVASPEFARVSVLADGQVTAGAGSRGLTGFAPAPERGATIRTFDSVSSIISKDLSFALTRLLAESRFKAHIDGARVGVAGHSIGGAGADQCAYDDARVRAAFDLDGTAAWNRENKPLQKPLLVMSAASNGGSRYDRMLAGANPGIQLRLAGSTHRFPMDISLVPPERAGSTPAARGLRITATFIRAFFDQYLNGQTQPLLQGPSPQFPEITFERGIPRVPLSYVNTRRR